MVTPLLESADSAMPPAASDGKPSGRVKSNPPREQSMPLTSGMTDSGSMSTFENRPAFQASIFSLEDSPAKISASPEGVPVWPEVAVAFFLSSYEFWRALVPSGSYSKTYPVCCQAIPAETWESYSPRWSSAGTASRIGFSTLSFSESPNDAVECSLSDILQETKDVPQRFYLSAKACAGILRRSAKRGVMLPSQLRDTLQKVAIQHQINSSLRHSPEDRTLTKRATTLSWYAARYSGVTSSEVTGLVQRRSRLSSFRFNTQSNGGAINDKMEPVSGAMAIRATRSTEAMNTASWSRIRCAALMVLMTRYIAGKFRLSLSPRINAVKFAFRASRQRSGKEAVNQDRDIQQSHASSKATAIQVAPTTSLVRRLTPLECERLQGFADHWTCVKLPKVRKSKTKDRPKWAPEFPVKSALKGRTRRAIEESAMPSPSLSSSGSFGESTK